MSDKTEELKTWPKPFAAVWDGGKGHEVRKADRPFEEGNCVLLREWLPDEERYTGRSVLVVITYITKPGTFGLPSDLCVFSFAQVERMDERRTMAERLVVDRARHTLDHHGADREKLADAIATLDAIIDDMGDPVLW